MSQPDKCALLASLVQEEAMDCLSETLIGVLDQLSPIARLRLLAFMHLIERPEALKASLEVTPSGSLSLTLDAPAVPCEGHQH